MGRLCEERARFVLGWHQLPRTPSVLRRTSHGRRQVRGGRPRTLPPSGHGQGDSARLAPAPLAPTFAHLTTGLDACSESPASTRRLGRHTLAGTHDERMSCSCVARFWERDCHGDADGWPRRHRGRGRGRGEEGRPATRGRPRLHPEEGTQDEAPRGRWRRGRLVLRLGSGPAGSGPSAARAT